MHTIKLRREDKMSKGKQRPPQYIRQSKGYQQNLYKQQLKERDVKIPKQIDMKKMSRINRILAILWIAAVVLVVLLLNWKIALIPLFVGIIYMAGFIVYINKYTKDYLGAYKKMGLTKEMYLKQLKKSGASQKDMTRMSKMWDKIKMD